MKQKFEIFFLVLILSKYSESARKCCNFWHIYYISLKHKFVQSLFLDKATWIWQESLPSTKIRITQPTNLSRSLSQVRRCFDPIYCGSAVTSLCCKVVVYSVNYSFCLNQISLNQFWNRISIISISYSCTCMWLQKEFTLL